MRLNRRSILTGTIGAMSALALGRVSAQASPWTLLDEASGPVARWDHVLLADAARQQLYVFGGRDGNGTALADLWKFDLATASWSLIDVPGPAPRFGMAAAVTPDGAGFFSFGGESNDLFFNDLWTFDFARGAWTLLDDGLGAAPSPRYGLGGDFDAAGRLVISHGFTFEGRFDDTWAYDAAAGGWIDISPPAETRPLRRCLHEVWAVEGRDRLLLYAGCSSGYGPCPQGDLWSFDVAADRWTQLSQDIAPAPRSNPAVSAADEEILLVGGLTEAGPTADVWVGELSDEGFVWNEIAGASHVIPPRSSHDMAAIDSDWFVFGGLGAGGALADLWRYAPDR